MRSRTIGSVAYALLASLAVASPATLRAHAGRAPEPHDAWTAWSLEPLVLVGLALAAWAYARGRRTLVARAWRRAPSAALPAWRARCHAAGILALVVALVSPVDAIGQSLFAGHMVQHLLLTLVAAPLLVLGDAGTAYLWALPGGGRRRVGHVLRASAVRASWRALSNPVVAWALHAAALVAWHLPSLYERAVRDDAVHALEHASFLLTAVLFWWAVAAPRARQRLGLGASLLYLFTGALFSTIFGALVTVAASPWYRVHARTAPAWGLTPLEDQQLAGLIMWVPAGLVYVIALAPIVAHGLRGSDVLPGAVRLAGPNDTR